MKFSFYCFMISLVGISVFVDCIPSELREKCLNEDQMILSRSAYKKVMEKIFPWDISSSKENKRADFYHSGNVLTKENFGKILDKYLSAKIEYYLNSFESILNHNSISTSIFDKPNRNLFEVETGRGRRRRYIQYLQTMLLGAWMLGTVVLGLTMKTIAIVAANAFLAALFSVVLSLVSAYGKNLKSFMGTIANPMVSNLYSTNAHQDAYGNVDFNSLETNAKSRTIRDIDYMLRKNSKSNDLAMIELF